MLSTRPTSLAETNTKCSRTLPKSTQVTSVFHLPSLVSFSLCSGLDAEYSSSTMPIYTLTHPSSLVLVVMMKSKEFKTKIYSHAHSLILVLFLSLLLSCCRCQSLCRTASVVCPQTLLLSLSVSLLLGAAANRWK